MEWKDCKEEILQSKKEVGGEWRGLRSVNVKKDLRNEKVKKRKKRKEKKERQRWWRERVLYIYIYIYKYMRECMREVLDKYVVATSEEMGLLIPNSI